MQSAAIIATVYGVLIAMGGIMGYVKAQSVASLITGVGSGIILVLCGYLLKGGQKTALPVALLVTVLILGRFGMVFFKNHETMPAIVAGLSLIALIGMILTSRGG